MSDQIKYQDFQTNWQPAVASLTADLSNVSQSPSWQWVGTFHCYLDGPKENVLIAFAGNGMINPGQILINQEFGRVYAVGVYRVSLVPNSTDGQTNDAQLSDITLTVHSPLTLNQTQGVQSTWTTSQTITFGVNGSVGAMMGEPTFNVGASWSDTQSNGYAYSQSFSISDWGVIDESSPETRIASWIFHQQMPYDMYDIGLDNMAKGGEPLYHAFTGSSPDQVKEFPDLSISTMTLPITATWMVKTDLIKQLPNNTISFNLNDSVNFVGYTAPNGPDANGGHWMYQSSGAGSWWWDLNLTDLLSS